MRELHRDGITDMVGLRLEYWDFVERATLDRLFPEGFPGTELEHASLLETSMMLLLRPELVEMDKVPSDGPAKFPTYDRTPVRPDLVPASGVLARAQGSTAEKGGWLIDDHVRLITEAVRREFKLAE
jgi:creatinine amidohydrolase